MKMPFPGMDPYLEHPLLWPGVHTELIVAFARQLNPRLRPRYLAKVERRVFLEEPEQQQRIPDLQVRQLRDPNPGRTVSQSAAAAPVVLEIDEFPFVGEEIREAYIEILDRYRALKVVTILELLSPANKTPGSGRDAYRLKQHQVLCSPCHLVEIDLLRKGRHTLSVPEVTARTLGAYDYLIAINRAASERHRFEVYPCFLPNPLPPIAIPLTEPDADVSLDLQAALEQVYEDGSHDLEVRYDDPCEPALPADEQQWAWERWAAYRAAHPELFPSAAPESSPPTGGPS